MLHISVYRTLPRTESSYFQGLFLEAAQPVLFHATAVHYYHGKDIEVPLFILEQVLQVYLKFKDPFNQIGLRKGQAIGTVGTQVKVFVART